MIKTFEIYRFVISINVNNLVDLNYLKIILLYDKEKIMKSRILCVHINLFCKFFWIYNSIFI